MSVTSKFDGTAEHRGSTGPVVVGYIPTPEGRAALAAAVSEARMRTTPLVIVNSAHGGAVVDAQLASDTELQAVVRQAEEQGVTVAVRQFPHGQDPVDAVLETLEQEDAGLLVIGMRRRSPVGKLFLGSTAQSLLIQSPTPVLAVKAH